VESYSYIERNGFFSMGSWNPPRHLKKIMRSRHLSRVKGCVWYFNTLMAGSESLNIVKLYKQCNRTVTEGAILNFTLCRQMWFVLLLSYSWKCCSWVEFSADMLMFAWIVGGSVIVQSVFWQAHGPTIFASSIALQKGHAVA